MMNIWGRDIGDLIPASAAGANPHRNEQQPARSHLADDRQQRRPGQRPREVPTIIIDRSALFRAGLEHILSGTRFRVIGGHATLADIPAKILHRPSALLLVGLDRDTPETLSELASLRASADDLRAVMMGSYFDAEEFFSVVEAGADGYLLKDQITPDALLSYLELVFFGGMVIPREFIDLFRSEASQLADRYAAPGFDIEAEQQRWPAAENRADNRADNGADNGADNRADNRVAGQAGLSNREQAILEHLMRGASNKHIARELAIAEATVKVYVRSVLRKIRVRNRTQAAMWAINHLRSTEGP